MGFQVLILAINQHLTPDGGILARDGVVIDQQVVATSLRDVDVPGQGAVLVVPKQHVGFATNAGGAVALLG